MVVLTVTVLGGAEDQGGVMSLSTTLLWPWLLVVAPVVALGCSSEQIETNCHINSSSYVQSQIFSSGHGKGSLPLLKKKQDQNVRIP